MNALVLAVTLILNSGDRIAVEGTLREENGAMIFRSGGQLYSIPAAEVLRVEENEEQPKEQPKRRLRVSEERLKELIAELEKNRAGTGTPPPPAPTLKPLPKEQPPAPQEEALWRSRARAHEEQIRRAQEEVALLEARVEELQAEISSLFALGYTPRDFTYQTTQLARTRERIPHAKLEVTRAQRAWDQFREEARKAGVMPGWLR
ncbi:MAG TPA: hypothetical protein VEO54_14595 [Thermoanaerobaculia bacterium]|nr:hypothetical protein [Thermoanaerobaculia bacterium]